MWVEFVVGSLHCSERFFSGYSSFLLSSKTNICKFQFDQESGRWRTTMWMCYLKIIIYFIYLLDMPCWEWWRHKQSLWWSKVQHHNWSLWVASWKIAECEIKGWLHQLYAGWRACRQATAAPSKFERGSKLLWPLEVDDTKPPTMETIVCHRELCTLNCWCLHGSCTAPYITWWAASEGIWPVCYLCHGSHGLYW